MKQKKRVLSFILACTMIFQSGMTTFAAENSGVRNQIVQEQNITENRAEVAAESISEVTTGGATRTITEPTIEPEIEPTTETTTEATTETTTEVTTEATTEDSTQAGTEESIEAEVIQESTLGAEEQLGITLDGVGEASPVAYALLKKDGNCYVTNSAGTKTDGKVITDNEVIQHVIVADDVTEINSEEFRYCTNLVDVKFSKKSSLTTIKSSAFFGAGMQTISLPDSVTTIEKNAFYSCNKLTKIEFGEQSKLSTIGDSAFLDSGLITITIPDDVTVINARVFYRCINLTTINFSKQSKLETIDNRAFNQSGLKEINIPDSVTTINEGVFNECKSLSTVNFTKQSKLSSIGDQAFYSSALEEIEIPAGVTSVGENAFSKCEKLTKVTFISQTAPTIGKNIIKDSKYAKIWVPYGTADAYIAALSINNSDVATTEYVKEYKDEVIFDRDIQTYCGDKKTDSFTYGEIITVKVTPVKTGNIAINEFGSTGIKPPTESVALFAGNTLLAEFKAATIDSEVSVDVDTKDKNLGIGENTITVVYYGSDELANYSETVTVTLTKKEITAAEVKPNQQKTYDGYNGFRNVALNLTGVEEGDVVTASADGTAKDALTGSNKTFSASSVTLRGLQGIYYSLKPTLVKGTVEIVKAEPVATMSVLLSGTGSKKTAALTAVVDGVSGAKTPSGTVAFMTSDGEGTEPIKGAEKVRLTNGKAVYKWNNIGEMNGKLIAVYSGDSNYNSAESRETVIDTSKKDQKDFSLKKIGSKTFGDTVTLSTLGGEGSGAVTFTSSDPTVIKIEGTTATILKAGETVITAIKAGDSEYNEATAQEKVSVNKKTIVAKPVDASIKVGEVIPDFKWTIETGIDGEIVTATNKDAVKMQAQQNGAAMNSEKAGTYDIVFTTEPVFEASDKFRIIIETGTLAIEKKTLSQDELTEKIEALDEMVLITNISSSLDSLEFTSDGIEQSGWNFLKDASGKSIQATPYANQLIQSFTAVYEDETYAPCEVTIPVTVVKLEGIATSSIPCVAKQAVEEEFSVVPVITGMPVMNQTNGKVQFDLALTKAFQNTANLETVYNQILERISITAKSKAECSLGNKGLGKTDFAFRAYNQANNTITLTVSIKDTEPKKGTTQFSTSRNIEIDQNFINQILLTPIDSTQVLNSIAYTNDGSGNLYVDSRGISKAANILEVTVGKSETDKLLKKQYTVTSSDKNVATVKALDEKLQITAKSAGTTTITVQARDKRKASASFVLTCKDYTPVLVDQTVTINQYQENKEALDIHAAYDNTISSIKIYEKGEELESSNFQVETVSGITYLSLKTNAPLKEKERAATKKCELRFVTNQGTFTQPITVKYEVKKPTAKLKCVQKVNTVAYPIGYYQLTSAYEIESVSFTPDQTSDGITITTSYQAEADEQLGIRVLGLNDTNRAAFEKNKAPQRTGVLKIHYKDYGEEADTQIHMEIPINKKAPALTTKPSVSYIYMGEGNNTESLAVYEKGGSSYPLSISDVTSLTEGVTASMDGNYKLKISYTGNKDRIVAELSVLPYPWSKAVTIKHEIRKAAVPELDLGQKKITLNTAAADFNTISVATKKNSNLEVAAIEATAVKTRTGLDLIESGLLTVSYSASRDELLLRASNKAPAGTYTILLDATTEQGYSYKQSKLTVVITDKTPSVRVSARGKIDAIDKGSIEYKVSLRNIEGNVKSVEMLGNQKELFTASVDSANKIFLEKKENAVVSIKAKYNIAFMITLDNGITVTTTPQMVRIGQKKPAYQANISKATMVRQAGNTVKYSVEGIKNYKADCITTAVELISYTDYFTYNASTGELAFNEENKSKLKRGTYRLEFKVPFTGEAVDGPVYKSYLTVYVK